MAIKTYSCDKCDFKSTHQNKLQRHINGSDFDIHHCESCSFKSCTKTGLGMHRVKIHEYNDAKKTENKNFNISENPKLRNNIYKVDKKPSKGRWIVKLVTSNGYIFS